MNWTKIFSINFIVFCALIFILELIGRVYLSINDNVNYFFEPKIRDLNYDLGLVKYDDELGYVPTPYFEKTINRPRDGWNDKKVSINSEGYRENDNNFSSSSNILAIGDSFTFGDQVSNDETWPACIERHTNIGVDNAGVFGYGSAQSVLRAKIISKNKKYRFVILSILLDEDFKRDTLSFRNGFQKPAVIKQNDELKFSSPAKKEFSGTKFLPDTTNRNKFLDFLYQYTSLGRTIMFDILDMKTKYLGNLKTMKHPLAASEKEIIQFTLDELLKINADYKVLLFQYSYGSFISNKDSLKAEKALIIDYVKDKEIKFVDTFDILKSSLNNFESNDIWQGHHTKFGNEIICKSLLSKINFNAK